MPDMPETNDPEKIEAGISGNQTANESGNEKKSKIVLFIGIILIIAGVAASYLLYFSRTEEMNLPDEVAPVAKEEKVEENAIDKELDTDQDGFPDYLEKIIGTDENKSDTDQDGYGDLAEIKNGYDPLTDKKYSAEEWAAAKEKIRAINEKLYQQEFGITASNPITEAGSFICGATTIRDMDYNTYNTVKIGDQCWLRENLKVTKNPAGEAITRYCYNNDPKICETDGGLYDWNTAMNKSTIEGAQGICPNGWHVPKDSEWDILENNLKDPVQGCNADRAGEFDCDPAGTRLKSGGDSGFEVVLSGSRGVDGSFVFRDSLADLWSSKEESGSHSWLRTLNSGSRIGRISFVKTIGSSVRCLKD